MQLRAPQMEALRELRDMLLRVPGRLSELNSDVVRAAMSGDGKYEHPYHPSFTLNLATGVGKSRLAGAIIAMLWLSGEARTFVILAPRRAVLRRLEAALDP